MIQLKEMADARKRAPVRGKSKKAISLALLPATSKLEEEQRTVGSAQSSFATSQTSVYRSAVVFVSGATSQPASPLEFSRTEDLEELEWRLGL